MIKKIILSLTLIPMLAFADTTEATNSDGTQYKAPRLAGDSLAIKALEELKIKVLLRYSTQYRDTNYNSTLSRYNTPSLNKKQQYSAIGGYLGYETPEFYNISLGTTLYTALELGNNPDERIGLGGLNEDDGVSSSYGVLGELYLKYKDENHDFRLGRREMPNYRFISLSNIRFSPITHEGATYENTTLDGVQFNRGYITKQKTRNSSKFIGMAKSARISENSIRGNYDTSNYTAGSYTGEDKSMPMAGIIFSQDNYTLELWDYYVEDFINTVYIYGDYNFAINKDTTLTTAFQYASQEDVGDSIAGNIDTSFFGLKAQVALNNGITAFTAYNQIEYNENSYDSGSLFVRWGTPQMFNSFQVQDSELAGTKSIGAGLQFELGKLGIVPNTVIRFRHAYYNMPDSINDRDAEQDRSETTFDLRYSFTKNDGFGIFTEMKGLSIQFRVAYNNYKTDYDYSAYRARHGYDFDTVRDDFVDTRLYIDYMF